MIEAILLDIEGTTTPIDFVYRVLFPYARAYFEAFLEAHSSEPVTQKDIADLIAENEADRSRGLDPPVLMDGAGGAPPNGRTPTLRHPEQSLPYPRRSTPSAAIEDIHLKRDAHWVIAGLLSGQTPRRLADNRTQPRPSPCRPARLPPGADRNFCALPFAWWPG